MRIVQLLRLTVLGSLGIAANGATARLKKLDVKKQDKRTKVTAGSPRPREHRRRLQEKAAFSYGFEEDAIATGATYPDCNVEKPDWVGDGWCDKTTVDDDSDEYSDYNSAACGWDAGDCCPCSCEDGDYECNVVGYECLDPDSQTCDAAFCDGSVCEGTDLPFSVADGKRCGGTVCADEECCAAAAVCDESVCEGGTGLNVFVGAGVECDGPVCAKAECCESDIPGYPGCNVEYPEYLGDGDCDGGDFNTEVCGWDGLDCCPCSCEDGDEFECGENGYDCLDPDNQTCDGFCQESVCEGTDLPFLVGYGVACDDDVCTAEECCDTAAVCDESVCQGTDLNNFVGSGKECDGAVCTETECCESGCTSDDDCEKGVGEICCPESNVCEVPVDPGACGDPHMTGFRGQKFDFTGEDGGWYSVLSVLPDLHLNMRVTSPVPSVPQITYITGISIKTTDGDGVDHTIVIAVNDPHSLESACPAGVSPCLADGALSVEVDGETALLAPGKVTLGPDVAIAAANLPGACRSFGFEKYWERKKAEYAQMGRRLSAQNGMKDMAEWILGDPTATNMDECTEYVARATAADGEVGLFSHDSEHTSFQILTPVGRIRLSHGRLHQLPMRDPTDMFDLPDHLTWQMNLAVDHHDIDENVARGILGETLVPTVDENGEPIMQGMGSIRGSQEDYRTEGPQGTTFALDIRHG